jgi:hypothetical protein
MSEHTPLLAWLARSAPASTGRDDQDWTPDEQITDGATWHDDVVQQPGALDEVLLAARLEDELRVLRLAEPRADAKANSLLSLASALLVAALAVVGSGKLPGLATAAAATGAGLLAAAVLLLTLALRPTLGGNFGFPRWARTVSNAEVLDALAGAPAPGSRAALIEQARQLRLLSIPLHRKFGRMATAHTLTGLALAAGVVTAALSALGR